MFRTFIVGIAIILVFYLIFFPLFLLYRTTSQYPLYITLSAFTLPFIVGFLAKKSKLFGLNFVAKRFLQIFGKVYLETLFQAAAFFCNDNKWKPFSMVVKIKINDNISVFGMVTQAQENLTVFVPTSPNPTSGFVLSVKEYEMTDILPEEFIRLIITSGAHIIDYGVKK